MNEFYYSQFIALIFGATAMIMGGMVMALLLLLMVFITIRDHLLNFDNEENSNVPPRVNFPGE